MFFVAKHCLEFPSGGAVFPDVELEYSRILMLHSALNSYLLPGPLIQGFSHMLVFLLFLSVAYVFIFLNSL